MKEMPWQDIYSLGAWNSVLNQYRQRKIEGSAKTKYHKLRYLVGMQRGIPSELEELTRNVRTYHYVEKRSARSLGLRIGLLNIIAALGEQYLNKYRIPLKPGKKDTMDYAVSKLVRRARRKARYLIKLERHLDGGDTGFTNRDDLLNHLTSESRSPDLVEVNPADRMEVVDPWHRVFDLRRLDRSSPVPFAPDGGSIFGYAFVRWIREGSDVPFFIWIEGHYVCTGGEPDQLTGQWLDKASVNAENVRQVTYRQGEQELAADFHLLSPRNSLLWAFRVAKDGGIDVDFCDTMGTSNGLRNLNMHAYVWSKDGFIFAAPHAPGRFHHSSFVSGGKVKCAGFIGVEDGKVFKVDNDSGHYLPPLNRLREFVRYLRDRNVLRQDVKITMVKGVKDKATLDLNDFLAWKPAIPSQRPKKKITVPSQSHVGQ